MLNKKDNFFNWSKPDKSRASRLGNVLRVAVGTKTSTVTLSITLVDEFELPKNVIHAAFDFSPDNPFVVFNPVAGVPFVKLEAVGNARSPRVMSRDLVKRFIHRFDLNSRCKYYDFRLSYWQTMRGMTLYRMEPIESDCEDDYQYDPLSGRKKIV